MKILIVRPSPNKMNLSSYNLQEIGLAKALVRKGHSCDVAYYCGKEKDHIETITFDGDKSINIIWLHGYGVLREGIYPSLRKYVKNYDTIQVGGYCGLTSCWLNNRCKGKVVNYQGPYFCEDNKGDIKKAKVFDKVLLPLCHKKNMILGTKSILATEYMHSKGIKDVTTIGVGLDLDNLNRSTAEDMQENELIRELQDNKGDNKYLLYIGVFEPRRNIPFLLETFKMVNEKMPNTRLVLIGKGQKDYVDMCFGKMDELGIRDKIIYRDRVEQKYMPGVYSVCDTFLLPTRYEIFGMVLLEAMYYGKPVFTTFNGGSSTLMNEENGIVIDGFDANAWSDKIVEVLGDEQRCASIGKNASKTIAEGYTWDALVDKFISVYEKRINSK